MTQVLIGDLRTGRRIVDLPFQTLSWSKSRNTAETIRCSVPLTSRTVRKLDLRNATSPAKTFMAVIENDVVMAAGPIWKRTYTKATGKLDLAGAGMWSYFDHRQIIPLLVDSANVIDPTTGESAAAANTDITLASYGFMAKKLVQQSMAWTGGNLPIIFQPDEAGTYENHWKGANLTVLGQALRDFTGLVNGVDIAFPAQRTPDRLGIQWLLRTGTLAQPEIHGNTVNVWDYSVANPSIRNLITDDDASDMTGQAWATGGQQGDDGTLVERAINHTLTNFGYPLLESVDSSHQDVSEADTLMQYAQNAVLLGSAPEDSWSFQVRADASPFVGSYDVGDFAKIKIAKDPWIPTDNYLREIATIAGDQDGKWIDITTQAVLENA